MVCTNEPWKIFFDVYLYSIEVKLYNPYNERYIYRDTISYDGYD